MLPWGRIVLAGIAATILSGPTDWFFFGIWMHERYLTYPEIWRDLSGGNENRLIAISIGFTLVCSIALAALCARLRATRWREALLLAAAIWLIAIVPLLAEQTLFVKMDPLLLIPSNLGWLIKLELGAAAAVVLLRGRQGEPRLA